MTYRADRALFLMIAASELIAVGNAYVGILAADRPINLFISGMIAMGCLCVWRQLAR